MPGSTEGSSGQPKSLGGGEELVQLSLIASPNNLTSATDTTLETELLPLKLKSLGAKAEPVETLSIASLTINQSTTDAAQDLSDESELLVLKQQSLAVKAETVEPLSIASPSDLQSASDFLDLSEKFPLTLQQREAISRRHHLKFITGHYGSGKVTVSHTCNWYMYTRI